MENPARLEDFGRLNIGKGSREGNPRWRCVNVWLCTRASVISRAACEGKRVSCDTGPHPIVLLKPCKLTHLTASEICLSCSADTHGVSWKVVVPLRWGGGAEEVMKELPIDSALKECRAGQASRHCVSGKLSSWERTLRSGLFHWHGFVLTSAWGCDNWWMTDGAVSAALQSPRGALLWPQVTPPSFAVCVCLHSFA